MPISQFFQITVLSAHAQSPSVHAQQHAGNRARGDEENGMQVFDALDVEQHEQHGKQRQRGQIERCKQAVGERRAGEQGDLEHGEAGSADQAGDGGPQAGEGALDDPVLLIGLQEARDDEDDDDRRQHEEERGQQRAKDAQGHAADGSAGGIADIGGHVDANRAWGGLGDGDHIGEHVGRKPAVAGLHLGEEGERGQTAADGEQAGLEELPAKQKNRRHAFTPARSRMSPSSTQPITT